MTALRRQWRRFRGLPASAQAATAIAVVAAYTAGLVLLLGGGTSTVQRGPRPLTPLEHKVSRAIQNAALYQQESTDVSTFRRPEVVSIRCTGACKVIYTVSVPGRGRILFQQLNMVRAIFQATDVQRVTMRVVRVSPHGPSAIPKSEEETPTGFPLLETTCDRKDLPKKVNWRTQKEAQAAVSGACSVHAFDQGRAHRGNLAGPG